jgi:chemotaxis protein MotB
MTSLLQQLQRAVPPEQSGSTGWMLIFADTLSLLLAFFVLLFSMSTLRVDTWLSMTNGLAQRLNPARYQSDAAGPSERNLPRTHEASAMNLGYLAPLIEDKIHSSSDLGRAVMTVLPDRIVVSVPADALFQAGDADLTAQGVRTVFTLGGLLGTIGNKVTIAAYTEPVLTPGQLAGEVMVRSIERAAAVAHGLADSGYGRATSAMGYADPAGQGYTVEPSAELRNRIDVVVLDAGLAPDTGKKRP